MRNRELENGETQNLFLSLLRYVLIGQEEELPVVKQGLEEKLEALVRRELYTKYKTASTPEDREKARKEYLDKRGVPENFRW